MFENNGNIRKNAIIAAAITPDYDDTSLDELKELILNIGYTPVKTILQYRNQISNTTCIGSGKLIEIKNELGLCDAELVVFDNQLSPTQLRNIEDALGIEVIDRTGVILQIFALRANSLEGKIQVELAQLQYLQPRLKGKGLELSRLAGGIGTRGPGESKLETDRRHIQRRITHLKKQLQTVGKAKNTQRKLREKNNVRHVSLCGYTNAGKSTMLNALTDSDVFACDMLFATLDSTTRQLTLPSGKNIIVSDTVGFIENLPHELIFAFKSTLDEIVFSDLVVLVADYSSPNLDKQIEVVKSTVSDIGYTGDIVIAYNKIDAIDEKDVLRYPAKNSVYVSAKTGKGLDKLLSLIDEKLSPETICCVKLPYDKIDVYYYFKNKNKITGENFLLDHLQFSAYANDIERQKYAEYIVEKDKN